MPDVTRAALDCEAFGAQGITVHPRPDERHIRRSDVREIRPLLHTEFNIEGNPTPEFMDLVLEVKPDQVTLVPDAPSALTSNAGWDTTANAAFLKGICKTLRDNGIRSSIFVNPDPEAVRGAAACGADRVELYTGPYADLFHKDPTAAIEMYRPAAEKARELGLGLNAGHDLSIPNLGPLVKAFPWIDEVSIGHQLISDALYLGIEETIRQYKAQLN